MASGQPGGHGSGSAGTSEAAKLAWRDQLLTARRRRPLLEIGEAARSIASHVVGSPEVSRAATVACYASVASEPGTGPLLDALVAAGKRVILPVLLPDNDLDWAVHPGYADGLVRATRGLLEPPGERLGVDAVGTADVVLVPGLAMSPAGDRLGRGGGSYDRALARVPVGTPVWVLLYAAEVGLPVPVEPHDRRVTGAVSPAGITRIG